MWDDSTVIEAIGDTQSERCNKQMKNDEMTNMRKEFHLEANK